MDSDVVIDPFVFPSNELRGRMVSRITIVTFFLSLLYLMLQVFRGDQFRIVLGLLVASVMLGMYLTNIKISSKLAGNVLIVFLWTIFAFVYLVGPPRSFFISAFVITFVYSLLLFGIRHLLVNIVFSTFVFTFHELVITDHIIPQMVEYDAILTITLLIIMIIMTFIPLLEWHQTLHNEIIKRSELYIKNQTQEAKYQHIMLQSPIGYFEMDIDGLFKFINNFQVKDELAEYLAVDTANTIEVITKVKLIEINQEILDLFEYSTKEELKSNIANLLLPETYELLNEFIVELYSGNFSLDGITRMQTSSGNILDLLLNLEIIKLPNSVSKKSIVVVEDISKLKQVEESLRKSNNDKSMLIKEIHHRVKNNLQIIISLLDLMLDADSSRQDIVASSKRRIMAMSLVHSYLLQTDSNQQNLISMDMYLDQLIYSILQSNQGPTDHIGVTLTFHNHNFPPTKAITIGLIISEIITNSIKHAFPSGKGKISIISNQSDNYIEYTIDDDGIGLHANLGMNDNNKNNNIGLTLIQSLSRQIDARLSIRNTEGTSVILKVPLGS